MNNFYEINQTAAPVCSFSDIGILTLNRHINISDFKIMFLRYMGWHKNSVFYLNI